MAAITSSSQQHRMWGFSIYLWMLSLLTLTSSQTIKGPDPSVCIPSDGSNPGPTPKLPDTFSARVECNILDKNYTTDVEEWYDQVGNRGAVQQWEMGVKANIIYDYTAGEYIMVLEAIDGTFEGCVVQPLSQTGNKYLFGMTKSPNGSESIYSVGGAMRFGRTLKETYLGVKRVRGILVDQFESCAYLQDFNASAKILWSFTAKDSWNTAIARTQVPVRCEIVGKKTVNAGTSSPFHHIYDFTDFQTSVEDDKYEIPKGAYCPHRKNTKSLPSLNDFFHYYAEIVIPEEKSIGFIKESYDYTINLVSYKYYPPAHSPYGTDVLVEVHDYNTGVAYITDPMLGNCSARRIESTSLDAHVINGNDVRIRTSQEFFNFNNASYHYIGERTVRNVKCDVWTALRHDWPAGVTGVNSTFEWYFAQPQVTEEIGYNNAETKVPVMLEVTVAMTQQNAHFVYNFYDYDEDQPMIWNFDISPCFNYLHRKSFKFALPGSFRQVVKVDEDLFKYYLIMEVQAVTDVTPLRINNIRVDYDQTDLIVSFTLLDVPPLSGDVTSHVIEVTLTAAVTKLTTAINQGKFKLRIVSPSLNGPVQMTAKAYSSSSWDMTVNEDTATPGVGYSAGIMGGTAVGLILVSFIIGFIVLYVVYRVRGGAFTPKKFDDHLPVIT
ncbi:uncharacterized protein [Haliotis cracherodii]|uniref:uncharacterized protein isoform X1 n=1 Tax=Haliotis cracherodii TaxID=6455 RepID=UPI0039E9BD3B